MKWMFVLQTIASFVLIWALNPANPHAYDLILQILCCAVFAYLAFHAVNRDQQGWAWVLGVTAVIYNPILRVHLTREIWSVVNIATIVVGLRSIFFLKREPETKNEMLNNPNAGDGL